MDYLLIIALQFIGVSLRSMQTIAGLRMKYPQSNMSTILNSFLYEDWNTLFVSGLVIILNLIVHYILSVTKLDFTNNPYYMLISYGVALVLGYAGQVLVYKWLGTAATRLDKEVTDKLVK